MQNKGLHAFFTKKLHEGKSYGTAMGAFCHKLLGSIYVILKENRPYEVL